MPGQITYTDALNYITSTISDATDDTQLIVTLRRLAVLCAGRQDGPELLEGFCNAYYGARADLRYREQLAVVLRGRN